jgi:membrane fusion protein, multidrug efflux system
MPLRHPLPWLAAAALTGTLASAPLPASADTLRLVPVALTEWKAVFGQVETRDRVPARARIGGTIEALNVTEGDMVDAGQVIARVGDDKLAFQLNAIDARLSGAQARLATAQADLARAESLAGRGVVTAQRLDQLRTEVDVLARQIDSTLAERRVIEQQQAEGAVLAPAAGVVLSAPLSRGSVVTPGEAVATIGGGGVFLRLAVPERHAATLAEGDTIELDAAADGAPRQGRLARLYPQIEGGRLLADVEVPGLDPRFVGLRMPVRLPVGERAALLVPEAAIDRAAGLDFVTVETPAGPVRRAVVPGRRVQRDGAPWRVILSGLAAGDTVVTGHD